ncbi:MAG: hypothetical protein JST00_03360 [Deltaproteobacteria bacterium]|nr:hypothetical protein [Deltaproteobacteria bacterium]
MARIEEATLFRPDPKMQYPGAPKGGGGGGGGGGGRGGGDEDDGPQIALGARVGEAARSAKRRKGLSFVVMMICIALTVLGAIFAPKTYEVESRVLVQRTASLTGQNQPQYVSPEEMRNIAREYEEQVMARDNILAIVKQKDLVKRWDDMRQPHRRLIDKINRKLGKPPPGDDEKFEALVGQIEHRMKVWVDATTVTVRLEWSHPEAARDIVDAAVKNFLDARFQSEVGVIPARLKMQEGFVAQAHKDLENAATELVKLQKANDPNKKGTNLVIPALPAGVRENAPADADPALKAKLEAIRAQIAPLQQAKQQRVAELNNQLIEKQQTLAPGHPEVIALKQTLAATEADSPQLASLKAQERAVLDEMAAQQKAAAAAKNDPKPAPRVAVPVPTVAPVIPDVTPAGGPKSVQDAQVRFDTVTANYANLVKQLHELQVQMQEQEAAYKNRYKITHPAEVPAAPKRPVTLIAVAIGLLATIAAVLVVAALADRFSGIFFEPRDVRDRLGLPVFATFS